MAQQLETKKRAKIDLLDTDGMYTILCFYYSLRNRAEKDVN